jgi:aminopeptidase N
MKTETPKTIYLKDYQHPDFLVDTIDLYFDLHEDYARIRSKLQVRRNPKAQASRRVVLNGEALTLEKLLVNDHALNPSQYQLTEETLSFEAPSDEFLVEVTTKMEPQKNLAFDGLYRSSSNFLTQCEPEGFRRITYFPDRPDVMAKYTVTIEAEKAKYPTLLSNGNKIDSRDLGNGRHLVKWQDPFAKPSYLFALVGGSFDLLEDHFVTRSGRRVVLQIFCGKGYKERCRWAMTSLKQAMKWDEDVYGLEYDLDIFLIVVAAEVNMGAMENKGLNIFNSKYVLADDKTATDSDFDGIQAVVGHEYFHNWTGNRVTCRDWFQLSLKEGLTVFRDQQFSSDMTSPSVTRIENVAHLRTDQFNEDSGPMAHPIRPSSYIEINNFYTRTVYEKGAEVIRMIHTILGPAGFRRGMDLYFKLFDGQAVRTEDFVHAMEKANDVDLTQFKNWYDQAGTPVVTAKSEYNAQSKTLSLTLSQRCPPSPSQPEKKPFHIPVAVGLLGSKGEDLENKILQLKEPTQTFTFNNVNERPVLSLLRGFSAPVKLEFDCSDDDLRFQVAHDSDPFCRWEAAQSLYVRSVQALVDGDGKHDLKPLSEAFGRMIANPNLDPALKSLLLEPPSETYLAQFFREIRPQAIHNAREKLLSTIGNDHDGLLRKLYTELKARRTNAHDPKSSGDRALLNTCLKLLVCGNKDNAKLAAEAAASALNMTEHMGALGALNRSDSNLRTEALNAF